RMVLYASLQDEWAFARNWEVTAGIRYDHYSDFGGHDWSSGHRHGQRIVRFSHIPSANQDRKDNLDQQRNRPGGYCRVG
ncbi:MAG: TonB-dependent receptor, partial [Candidatus Electrothrix sp. ATG2]|nr:TonB-dependent receptor [Candidatus Electrothrix sp. ATG2]